MNNTTIANMAYAGALISLMSCASNGVTNTGENQSSSTEQPQLSSSSIELMQSSAIIEIASSAAILASSSSISADPTMAAWHDFSTDNAKINMVGRGDLTDPLAPVFGWSGSAWSIAFEGSAVKIKLSAMGSIFNVFLDGDTIPTSVLDLSANADTEHLLVENLPYGTHTVTVFKRTEAQYGDAIFKGFSVYGSSTLKDLPAAPVHKIEYIGNSITCGYGNLDSVKENGFHITTEDHYWTYAAFAARMVNAEHHAECYSGRGVYRNNTGSMEGTLPELFPLITPNSSALWDFSRWTADVVAVNLGTNDFYISIPDSAGFVNASVAFINSIRAKYPLAKIFMLDGPMLSDYYPNVSASDIASYPINATTGYASAYFNLNKSTNTYTYKSQTVCKRYLNAAKDILVAQGNTNIVRYSFPAQSGSNGYGADWHPSKKQHAAMANMLASWIRTEMSW